MLPGVLVLAVGSCIFLKDVFAFSCYRFAMNPCPSFLGEQFKSIDV